jgi:LisH domain-containing protein ARMC9
MDNNELLQRLQASEKRAMSYMKKFHKVQADYHTLIGFTADLVESLEATVSGQPVTPEYYQNIANKLFSTQLHQTIDFTRPGTAGEQLRKSLAFQKSNMTELRDNDNSWIDFEAIKYSLLAPTKETNEKNQLLLLQALRWRLTRAENSHKRQQVVDAFIQADILNLNNSDNNNSLITLLNSKSEFIRQSMARFINALASLNQGRMYLSNNINLIKLIEDILKKENTSDTVSNQNLLAALQKLSLK